MVQMVRVLEALPPDSGFLAEVPGRSGRFVRADSLGELRKRLRAALNASGDAWFDIANRAVSCDSNSETALFLRV